MRALSVLLLLLLASCGDLPQPFFGNPGLTASRLAQPPPSRLSVRYPAQSLLPDAAATTWARSVAAALVEQEIPADARRTTRGDWSLVLSAEIRGNTVIPSYTVENPAGQSQAVTEGAPVPAAEWAAGTPAMLQTAAAGATPNIVAMLDRVEAARRQSDPNSLLNRPARIFIDPIASAPGDGAISLPTQMRKKLEAQGLVVQDTPKGADYELRADIKTAPGINGTVRVELQWIVVDSQGERGRILQINEVPPNTIVPYWGDTAVAVATEAAGGVKDVILNATTLRSRQLKTPQPPARPPQS